VFNFWGSLQKEGLFYTQTLKQGAAQTSGSAAKLQKIPIFLAYIKKKSYLCSRYSK